jgi:CheY-like chemotaxis protein
MAAVAPLILVVEDDADLRESLCDVLADAGYQTASAPHGAAALSLLQGGLRPALILLDLMMPIMSGWEFREAQLGDSELSGLPVMIMTASRHLDEEPAGVAEIMYKPLRLEALLAAINRHAA